MQIKYAKYPDLVDLDETFITCIHLMKSPQKTFGNI